MTRVRLDTHSPLSYAALLALADAAGKEAADAGLAPRLLELVRIRASQLNGCGFCLDLHTRSAEAAGEATRRLHTLAAWRHNPLFDARERAALDLTEAVTLLHVGQVPDEVYRRAAERFDDAELAALLWTITVINAFNRIAVSTRVAPVSAGG